MCLELSEGIRPPAGLVVFLGLVGAPGLVLAHIDQGRIDHIFEVRRVVLLDHLDTGAAVFGDLIDISAFQQAETNIAVAQAAP